MSIAQMGGPSPARCKGPPTQDMRATLPLTDALKRELPTMLREHRETARPSTSWRGSRERKGYRLMPI